ncbi:hypothetical protein DW352_23425 [Pseudolabrys taiwanensis]|uniref:Uncharacterized protein n=1 Tax=Pseudolabrys taiwanensis TaxID=331696 RepID=A0A346A211_9HYPH|nr:hypothetical protein [Pseudolabrys taiwanensis]AXK83208.1 hypothetical protein DW352_23425 [Pseudolabrys taiwanensis]
MKRFGRLCLVAAGALAFTAGAAQAFTFTDQNGNAGNAQGYVDLDPAASRHDIPASRFGTPNSTVQSGDSTIKFFGGAGTGGGSFNQRYNSNNLFDPYARDGR